MRGGQVMDDPLAPVSSGLTGAGGTLSGGRCASAWVPWLHGACLMRRRVCNSHAFGKMAQGIPPTPPTDAATDRQRAASKQLTTSPNL